MHTYIDLIKYYYKSANLFLNNNYKSVYFKKNAFNAFNLANLDLIDCNLNDLDNDFGYLFLTFLFLVYSTDWGRTNNPLVTIDRGQ